MKTTILAIFIIIFITFMSFANNSGANRATIYHPQHPLSQRFVNRNVAVLAEHRGRVRPFPVGFAIEVEMGNTTMFLDFDTGSFFIWVEFYDCITCLPRPAPFSSRFNGSAGLGFKICDSNINCYHEEYQKNITRCIDNRCMYREGYTDGTSSVGFLVNDFVTPFTDRSMKKQMDFGAGIHNRCSSTCYQGMAGFGYGAYSLPGQLGVKKWGFCLPHDNKTNGTFVVEDEAQIPGPFSSAHLIQENGLYLSDLTEMRLDGVPLMLSSLLVTTMVLIDTGSDITYLLDEIFDIFKDGVKFRMWYKYGANMSTENNPFGYEICYDYDGDNANRIIYELDVSFLIDEEVDISTPHRFGSESIWDDYPTIYKSCLGFRRRGGYDFNVIGTKHITGYTFVYDLTDPKNLTLHVSDSREECLTPSGVA